jgi:hypothetical protein
MTDWPAASLCQMAAVRARMRCRTRTVTPAGLCPPWRSRSSCFLRVSLTDSMTWRKGLKNSALGRPGWPFRAGWRRASPAWARAASKSRP